MKNPIKQVLFFALTVFVFTGCEKTGSNITYQKINKEFVLIRNVETLLGSNDEISNHVDSIFAGLIIVEFISTGQKDLELNKDGFLDLGFEIIDLNKFNPNGLPESFDSLAARVIPLSADILDNSTYGYPDALNRDDEISVAGNWSHRTSVLGTFLNGGKFQGKGEKYLGVRFPMNNTFKYGWVKLYCSQHNDTLRIIDFAFNNIENSSILAGQVE